jgi:2Fe-2S ferredoxin
MGDITLRTRDGAVHRIAGRQDVPLMEIIRDAGFDELMAMCGGCLSCATCHVYVDHVPEGAAMPEVACDEDGLLDGSDHRRPASRLSCQIRYCRSMAGIALTIAPEE